MNAVLVAALSGRALAAAARADGYRPLVADLFGDLDLGQSAARARQADGDLARGFAAESLLDALVDLARDEEPLGLVYGAGFEDRPDLMTAIAERWRVLGNPAPVLARAKDPWRLAELCADLGIPHPEIRAEKPEGTGWLAKRAGASGGAHVGAAERSDASERTYWQKRLAGVPISALVVANGRGALTLGLSEQWTDPAPGAPFRYGGAVQPARLAPPLARTLAEAAEKAAAALGLVGLNGVDFLVGPQGWWLVEVNPRPGAALDVFGGMPLFRWHVEAVGGRLPARPAAAGEAFAAAIVYARQDIDVMPSLDWTDWTADRQQPGTRVPEGAPICTVLASAHDPAAARLLAERRMMAFRAALEAAR